MNSMKFMRVVLFTLSVFVIFSCGTDDPCDDFICPTGYVCDNGICVDENPSPCNGECPEGFSCVNDLCVENDGMDCGESCPAGFTCVDNECVSTSAATIVISGSITSDVTWSSENFYELAGKVVVENGATLTIEPGTIIKGREGTGSLAAALIVARGSKIEACGTADEPIIFTSVLDNIEIGQKVGTNLSETTNELWGGLIILGAAPISAKDGDTEAQIEGIPGDETYGLYGGSDPMDDSGSLCYVSLRHGGALIGDGNEINGITLGGVGAGTTINNIEVVANLDDGVEFFGGTVSATNVIVTYQGDDAIDLDMNYSGTIKNVMVIHGGPDTDEAFEIDGPENSTHTDGKFLIQDATAIAIDTEKTSGADFKSKAQGTIENSVWIGYKSGKHAAVRASFDTENVCADKSDALTNALAGDLVVANCEFVTDGLTAEEMGRVYIDSSADDATELQACLDGTDYEAVLDAALVAAGNVVATAATKGADRTVFEDWTWSDLKGFLNN